jgi:hypothetical protein
MVLTARVLGLDPKPLASEKVGVLFVGDGTVSGFVIEIDVDGNLKCQVPETQRGLREGSFRLRGIGKDSKTSGGYRIEFATRR